MTKTIADEFIDYLNEFHSYSEPYDDELDAWLHKAYSEVLKEKKDFRWDLPYFSPSSAGNGARELYVKAKRKKRDNQRPLPHQRRWTALGTAVGDVIQRELLLAERHYEKFTGKKPRFVVGVQDGRPTFEDFVFKSHQVDWNGQSFYITGTCDGILFDTKTGEKIGLEIKSKQETPSKTSYGSMKEANQKHIDQVVSYGEMYGIDRYIILYVNTAKKKWFASEEELAKTPDIRAFEINITDDMRAKVFDYLADIVRRVKANDPPKLDLEGWRFNGFKRACALDLSSEELDELEDEVSSMENSYLPSWKKRVVREALDEIKSIRTEALGDKAIKVDLGGI